MSTATDVFKCEIESLSPEILLKIFLCLDSHETVILRSVCKEFLEIIDNNKSLWRILDCLQERNGSAVQALEKFDDKSASTLEKVSIFQRGGSLDNKRLIQVLNRSKNSFKCLSFHLQEPAIRNEIIELASNAPLLTTLILWRLSSFSTSILPETRPIQVSSEPVSELQQSKKLRILWCYNLGKNWNGKLDVSSLISFADPVRQDPLQLRSVISNFSQSIIHLSISLDETLTRQVTLPSLSCPSLRILEGQFYVGFPAWLEAPNLRVVIANFNEVAFISELPTSVEELWLLSKYPGPATKRNLHFLPQVCPRLKVLKLGKTLMEDCVFGGGNISEFFRSREEKVQGGVEIEGIKMVSLEKLIVPTQLFGPAELKRLRDLVGEVINMKDYPDFIELEY